MEICPQTKNDIHAKWVCLRKECYMNGREYMPSGYCDKALCPNREQPPIPPRCYCNSCKYFDRGFVTGGGNISNVCKANPKPLKWYAMGVPKGEVYFAASPYKSACHQYEPKQSQNLNNESKV